MPAQSEELRFYCKDSCTDMSAHDTNKRLHLPVPYRLPPEPYSRLDRPWTVDEAHPGADVFGHNHPALVS